MTKSPRSRWLLLWINLAVFLCAANWIILEKEDHLDSGRTLLLVVEDYVPNFTKQSRHMVLTYPICREISAKIGANSRGEGTAVIRIDANQVGHFRRLHTDETLAEDEILLHYRIRSGPSSRVRVAAQQFFFQQGLAKKFEHARYAELRVTPEGHTLLVALCDAQRRRIGD